MAGVIGPMLDLGPCQVLFNNVDLGPTDGSVKFKYTEQDAPVKEDQEGSTPVDEIITGQTTTVEVPLTRMGLASLNTLMAGCSGSGTAVASGSIAIKSTVGTSRYSRAKELILKPYSNGVPSTDAKTWLHVYKASPKADFELVFGTSGQRAYKFTFTGFPDRTAGVATERIWGIGPTHA